MTRSAFMSSALGAAFLAAVVSSAPAYALDAGQCGTKAEIMSALQSEGQVQVISGRRAALGLPKNVFTTNSDLSVGYNIEAGVDSEAGKVCVGAKYTNVRFNADPNLSRPSWASFGKGTAHDDYLARAEAKANDKVLLGATAVVKREDGTEAQGPFIMVMRGDAPPGGTLGATGVATATTRQGGITTLLKMGDVETNDNFSKLAKARVQTASVDSAMRTPR